MDLLEEGLKDPISHWYYKHKYHEILNKILKYKSEFKTLSEIVSRFSKRQFPFGWYKLHTWTNI
jgi:hypothetical protein